MQNMQNMPDEFPADLPEIGPAETFCFACGPEVPCFNRCCADLTLPLTPYDVLRLKRQLGMSGIDFLRTFTELRSFPETGFPLPLLRMITGPESPCPFVTPAGCSVYEDRPGACRSYPLGRGTRLASGGVAERYFLVREDHCKGFERGPRRTPSQWFREEGLGKYNEFNDRYMRLMSMVKAGGGILDARMAGMCLLCLYQLEHFRDLIVKMDIFSRVEIGAEQKNKIMLDSPSGDEACLDFAFDWLELAIFGKSDNLGKKEK